MLYRICKSFEIESGHMLSRHPGRCRFPHGHSRRIDVVLASPSLDANDMVCDFKLLKLALSEFLDRFDHAMLVNSDDPGLKGIEAVSERVITFKGVDPTTEVLARHIYEFIAAEISRGHSYDDGEGGSYCFPDGLTVERVRVMETSTSWAEFGG